MRPSSHRIRIAPLSGLPLFLSIGLLASLAATLPAQSYGLKKDPAGDDPPRIIATYYPLFLFTQRILRGIEGPLLSLLLEASGGCAHGLALRPSQVTDLRRADIVIESGLGLETFLENSRLPLSADVIRISAVADIPAENFIAFGDTHDHAPSEAHDASGDEHAGHGHADHGAGNARAKDHGMEAHDHELHGATPAMNPHAFNGHAWSDPSLAARMIQAIAKQLAEADPPRAASYQSNAAGAAAELQQLATNLYAAAEPSSGARVVLSHTSLAYLARSFGWNVIATIHDGDEKAPGPRALGRMIDQARASGVDAVIVDPQDHGRLGELVARETGCDRIVELDPAASGPMEPDAYMNIMQSNLHALRSWSSPPRQPGGAS